MERPRVARREGASDGARAETETANGVLARAAAELRRGGDDAFAARALEDARDSREGPSAARAPTATTAVAFGRLAHSRVVGVPGLGNELRPRSPSSSTAAAFDRGRTFEVRADARTNSRAREDERARRGPCDERARRGPCDERARRGPFVAARVEDHSSTLGCQRGGCVVGGRSSREREDGGGRVGSDANSGSVDGEGESRATDKPLAGQRPLGVHLEVGDVGSRNDKDETDRGGAIARGDDRNGDTRVDSDAELRRALAPSRDAAASRRSRPGVSGRVALYAAVDAHEGMVAGSNPQSDVFATRARRAEPRFAANRPRRDAANRPRRDAVAPRTHDPRATMTDAAAGGYGPPVLPLRRYLP